jgi:hypothetical protein
MKKIKYPTYIFFLLLYFASSRAAHAYDATLSLGNLCEFVGRIQTDDSGSINVCSFNPYLASSVELAVNEQLIFAPEIGFSFPKHGRDENISKMSLFALANAKYRFSMFHFIGGAGLFFSRISGKGGTEDLNNGNGTVSFPMPETTVYARNFIVNLGLGIDLNKSWGADLHTFIFNALTSEDRAFSIAINGTYHFGEF